MNDAKTGADRLALERLLHAPDLAQVVPHLPAEVLHEAIRVRGLEDCGEWLVAATPEQLTRLLDLDLWRADRAGGNETFDADRFGVWLDVLVDMSPALAAQKLAERDPDFVIAGLVQHVRVFDRAAVADYTTTDGTLIAGARFDDRLTADVGGHVIVAKRDDAWGAIVSVLTSLEAGHADCFREVMRGCRSLSNSGREVDGLDELLADDAQAMLDVAIAREERREERGYVGAADARAFLETSRRARITVVHHDQKPARSPGVRTSTTPDGLQPRPPRLARIDTQMQFLIDRDAETYAKRNAELAFLANTLMAGASIQDRAFTEREAWDAAVATCNLALETVDAHDGFLVAHGLVEVFQTGWTILHDDVAMYAAERLADVLKTLRCGDRETQAELNELRRQLTKQLRAGTPWQARPAMDVLASLDMPAWAALLGLVAECPVLHAGVAASQDRKIHAVNASEFEFISEQAQIFAVRAFVTSLPETLRG